MNLLDVNVLVALYRDDCPPHLAAESWWQRSLASGEPFVVPDVCWTGFLRVVTNTRVFAEPAPVQGAIAFARAVRAQGQHLGNGYLPAVIEMFEEMCAEAGARGNLVTDAYLAATARSLGATLVTFDRDFRRFDGLRLLELT
jgi:uncharacterized protein